MNLLKQYRGAVLLLVNLVLIAIIVFGQNALNLFKTGYDGADPIIDLSEKQMGSIKIIDPDNHGKIIELTRTNQKRKSTSLAEEKKETPKPVFEWDLGVYNPKNSKEVSKYRVDAERLKEFLQGLENTRDYYALNRTPQKDVELEMASDSTGSYKGLQIIIQKFDSNKKYSLYVGKTNARGSQSYVRLNDQKNIFLVETNLRSITGSGEIQYFRDRQILSDKIKSENITMLDAMYLQKKRNVQLSKQAQQWFITAPTRKAADSSLVSSLMRDITGWKASNFYDSLPADHDPASLLKLGIYYNHTGNITDQLNQGMTLFSKKEQNSTYYLQLDGQKSWFEINSIYLEDLKTPLAKFAKPAIENIPSGQIR